MGDKKDKEEWIPSNALISIYVQLLDFRMWMKRVKDSWVKEDNEETTTSAATTAAVGAVGAVGVSGEGTTNIGESKEETLQQEEKEQDQEEEDDDDDDDDNGDEAAAAAKEEKWTPPLQQLPLLINTPLTFDQHILQVTQRAHFLLSLAPSTTDSTTMIGKDSISVTKLTEKWNSILPQSVSATDSKITSPTSSPKSKSKNNKNNKENKEMQEIQEDNKDNKDNKDDKDDKDDAGDTDKTGDKDKTDKEQETEMQMTAKQQVNVSLKNDTESMFGSDFLKYLQTGQYAPPGILLSIMNKRQERARERIHGMPCMLHSIRCVTIPSVLADVIKW